MAWLRAPHVLAMMVGASFLVRFGVSLFRHSLLLYPDEYIYSALARSVAADGLPRIRGSFTNFHAVLVPYLMAPAWWVHPVEAGFRVVLALGSLWFSLAAIPIYLLARRVGVSERGSLVVAVLALLVPEGVYTTTQLTEPYAYPLFLAAILLAVDTLSTPTRPRQALVVVAFALLFLARTQFVVFPLAYLAAALACSGWSPRRLVRRQTIVVAAVGAAVVVGLSVGLHRVAGYYSNGFRFPTVGGLGSWFAAEVFIVLIASGWVLAPFGIAGVARMAHSLASPERAFAWLALPMCVVLAGEAGFVDALQDRSHERYAFYVAPLVVVAALRELERREPGVVLRAAAYVCAAGALLLPATATLREATNAQAPTMVGLQALVGDSNRGSLAWALVLSAGAVLVSLRLLGGRAAVAVAAVLLVVVGVGANVKLLAPSKSAVHVSSSRPSALGAPAQTSLLTSAQGDKFQLMRILFWNPSITSVRTVGGGAAPDGYAAGAAYLTADGFVDDRGMAISGPFAVTPDETALPAAGGTARSVFASAPALLAIGLNSADRYLSPVAELYARAPVGRASVLLGFVSRNGLKGLAVKCGEGAPRNLQVGARPVALSISVPAGSVRSCRISLVRGAAVSYANRLVSVRVTRLSYIADRSKR